jgi:hypothetical protein
MGARRAKAAATIEQAADSGKASATPYLDVAVDDLHGVEVLHRVRHAQQHLHHASIVDAQGAVCQGAVEGATLHGVPQRAAIAVLGGEGGAAARLGRRPEANAVAAAFGLDEARGSGRNTAGSRASPPEPGCCKWARRLRRLLPPPQGPARGTACGSRDQLARQHAGRSRCTILLDRKAERPAWRRIDLAQVYKQARGADTTGPKPGAPPGLTLDLDHVGQAAVELHDVGVVHHRQHRHLHRVLHRPSGVLGRRRQHLGGVLWGGDVSTHKARAAEAGAAKLDALLLGRWTKTLLMHIGKM